MKSYLIKQGVLGITLFIISALTIFSFSTCKKEDKVEDDNEIPTNDNYYVKYIIKEGNGSYSSFSNWTVTTPQGKYSNNGTQVSYWNKTYGPVGKGFYCEVKIGSYSGGAPSIEIHVSKNQEPFALKVSKTGTFASYTIDF